MRIENGLAVLVVLLAPAGFIYSWYFYFAKLSREPADWRNRVTLASLLLVSSLFLLCVASIIVAPKVDPVTYAGAPAYQSFTYGWAKFGLRALCVPFILCFLGRPRLIAPIAVACVGVALFWLGITMP
jgi:hypothetical protein